jgi:hypothetical protein
MRAEKDDAIEPASLSRFISNRQTLAHKKPTIGGTSPRCVCPSVQFLTRRVIQKDTIHDAEYLRSSWGNLLASTPSFSSACRVLQIRGNEGFFSASDVQSKANESVLPCPF